MQPLRNFAAVALLALAASGRTTAEVCAQTDGRTEDLPFVVAVSEAAAESALVPAGEANREVPPRDELTRWDQPPSLAPEPPAPVSALLERLNRVAAPMAAGVIPASEPPEIETIELTRRSNIPTSISGIRRSPVAIQPVVRGYQQQSLYGQYNGAQFVAVRHDLDSLLSSIDPGLIDNLVIIPGPYGVRYGPGLAFIDVAAAPAPRYDVPEWHSRTNLLYQSNGQQFYGRETVFGGGARYGFRASYGHKTGNDYQSGDGTSIPASYNVRDFNAVLSCDPCDGGRLDFEYLRQDMTNAEFAGLVFDARLRQTDAFFLRYTYDDPCWAAQWLAEGWYNETAFRGDNLNPSKQFFYRDNPMFIPAGSFAGFTDARLANTGLRIAPTWGDEEQAHFHAGADLHYTRQRLNEFDDFAAAPPVIDFDNFPVPRSSLFDVGMFSELTVPVRDAWKLTAGGRVDWVRTHRAAEYRATDPAGVEHLFDFGSESDRWDALYHGFLAADYELTAAWKLRFGAGHSQRPPSLTERFGLEPYLTVVQSATSAVLGDENLKPERATQVDAALVADYADLRFRLGGFWSFVHDHITLAPGGGVPPPDPDLKLLDFVNADAVLAGGEFSAEYDWTPCLQPSVNLSYVDGRNLERHEPLPSIFPWQTRLGVLWHDPEADRFGLQFLVRRVERQGRVATSLAELPTAGFTVFDLRGYWQVSTAVRITCGLENLTNQNYLEHLNVHVPQVYEPGRTVYLATQFEY